MKRIISIALLISIIFVNFITATYSMSDSESVSAELVSKAVKTNISETLWEDNQITANYTAYADFQISPVSVTVVDGFCIFTFSDDYVEDIIVEIYDINSFDTVYFETVECTDLIKLPVVELVGDYKFLFRSKYNAFYGNFIFHIEDDCVVIEDDIIYVYSVSDIEKYIDIVDSSIATVSKSFNQRSVSESQLFNSVIRELPSVYVSGLTFTESETNNGTANADNLSDEVMFNYTVVGTITYDADDTFQEVDVFRNLSLPFNATITARIENTSSRNRITAELLTGTGTVVSTGTQSSASSALTVSSHYSQGSNFYVRIKLEPFYVTNNPETTYEITFGIALDYSSALDVVRSPSAPTSFTGDEDTDCYNYVNRNPNSTYNVGGYHGVFTEDFTSVSMIVNYFMEDCYEMTGSYPVSVGDPNTYSGNIPEGSYLIALFTGILQTSYAYHFYLQGSNKTWSHTYPGKDILYKDGCEFRDITIYNPIYSCRYAGHYYDNFIGFYLISSYVD
ncbi:MAG: hypothetical protein IJE51_00700 [Clostridia bacterium]|nr:hypothetical protein [Clostridia bacterium]